MKKKALGFVAFATAFMATSAFAAGAIRSIDPCDELGYLVGVDTKRKTAGDKAYFRIRLLNVNSLDSFSTKDNTQLYSPWIPDYNDLTLDEASKIAMWTANPPKIGVYVSGQLRGATVGYPKAVTAGDYGWEGWYTDLVCSYTVQPGDIALPMTLANAAGREIGNSTSSAYYLDTIPKSGVWRLIAYKHAGASDWATIEGTNICELAFGTSSTSEYGGTAVTQNDLAGKYGDWTRDYSLAQAGHYIQSVDFAKDEYEVAKGQKAQVSVDIIGGVNTNGNGTIYALTKDLDAITIAEDDVETVTIADGYEMDGTYQVCKITIPSGVEATPYFRVYGVESNKQATVYLAATKKFVYGQSGDLVTNFVTAVVKCTEPPPPYITVTIDEKASQTVTAGPNYSSSAAKLTVTLSQAFTNEFTVNITPSMVSGSGTEPLAKYISLSTYSEDNYLSDTHTLTFPAGTLSKDLYIYVLGADNDTAGAGKGISFAAAAVEADAAAYFSHENVSATLYIKKSTPVIAFPTENYAYTGLAGGVNTAFTVKIADDYADIQKPYTVEWYKTGSGSPFTIDSITPNADGEVTFSVRYNYQENPYNTTFRVKNSTDVWSDYRRVTVQVNPAKQVSAVVESPDPDGSGGYPEYDDGEVELSIRFKLTEGYDDSTLYAFLVPQDEASSNLVVCKAFTTGVAIKSGDTESTAAAKMQLLDGNDDSQPLVYSIVLRTAKNWTTGDTIGIYESKDLEIYVNNVAPKVAAVNMSGSAPLTTSGGTFGGKASVGLNKIFTIEAEDVDADLTNNVTAVWTFVDPNGYATTYTVTAPLDDIVLTNVFEVAGTYTGTVKLHDKDMGSKKYGPEFAFSVVVLDKPSLVFDFPNSNTFGETEADRGESMFYVQLSTPASRPIEVELECTRIGADGVLNLATNRVAFRAGQMQETVYISELDGTADSLTFKGGFSVTAKVITETLNEDGIAWKDVYLPATTKMYVRNEVPTIDLPIDYGITNSASINVEMPITWKISDVGFDMTNSLTVTWDTSEGIHQVFTGDAVFQGVFTNVFSNGGAKVVTMTVTDKDNGMSTVNLFYRVAPSKKVTVYPQGPYKYGGLSDLSKRYTDADGRGEGRVWCEEGTKAFSDFALKLTFGVSASMAEIFALGYKYGQLDDGTLTDSTGKPGRDIAIDTSGDSLGDTGTPYKYEPDPANTNKHFDCFFYAWVIDSTDEQSVTYTGKALVSPQSGNIAASYKLSLPTEKAGDDEHPYFAERYIEAFFSKELYVTDNMGDMNADGIPDKYATMAWSLDSGETQPICQAMTGTAMTGDDAGSVSASDLSDVSAYNGDGDFLPKAWQLSVNPLKPTTTDWSAGEPFRAIYEIRGLGMSHDDAHPEDDHLGLNELGVSEYDLSPAEKCALFADCVAAGIQLTNETYDANYAAATNWAAGAGWTPEAVTKTGTRLNPCKGDTDGDGYDDGWEYYFWYFAKVGAITNDANGAWGRLEGRRYDVMDPARGTRIPPAEIANAFNPLTAAPGGRDFDNDGLTDFEEYILGTNPCDWDSDGDGLNDLWEVMNGLDPLSTLDGTVDGDEDNNPDRDFMARCEYAEDTFTVYTFANGEMFGFPTMTSPTFEVDDSATQDVYEVTLADGVGKCWFTNEPPVFIQSAATGLSQLAADTVGYENLKIGDVEYLGAERTFAAGMLIKAIATNVAAKSQVYADFKWRDPVTLEVVSTNCALPLFNYGNDGVTYVPCTLKIEDFSLLPTTNSPLVRVETNHTVTLIHNQVLTQYGFDPRVAWGMDENGFVDQRWHKSGSEDENKLAETGLAVNTWPYSNLDEYLVMQYRQQLREIGEDGVRKPGVSLLHYGAHEKGNRYLVGEGSVSVSPTVLYFRIATTYPNYPVAFVREAYSQRIDEVSPFENSTNRAIRAYWTWLEVDNDIHGADTDADGIPDGWELYINADPTYSDDAKLLDDWAKDEDSLTLLQEYAGVDSCNAYTNRFMLTNPSKKIYPEAETITKNHPGRKSGWWNKFFPTNPFSEDTDGDGVKDDYEGKGFKVEFYVGNNWYGDVKTSFIYGTDENRAKYDMDGSTTCFRGGGLNPCTVDTDGDLLPDAWEYQFAGIVFKDGKPEEGSTTPDDLRIITMADGSQKALAETGSEIRGGMDGTWKGDPCLDFDHDGLPNYQEYLVQSLRHLRYDDNKTPLMGMDPRTGQFLKFIPFGAWDGEFFHKKCLESGFTGLGTWQFRDLGYFARPPHEWDMLAQNTDGTEKFCTSYEDSEGAGYRVMLPPCAEIPGKDGPELHGVYINGGRRYACTDPRRWDSDHDGMDDYYELFHGLNPLLGSASNLYGSDDYGWSSLWYYDVIGTIYDGLPNAWCNHWTGWPLFPAVPPFDAIRYPWMIGTPECDADGDGLRNDEESLKANLAAPSNTHTDPTPLWMTDSTSLDSASFTSQYYRFDPYRNADAMGFPWDDYRIAMRGEGYVSYGNGWMFPFEENEGYDTDHDFKTDSTEMTRGVEMASNPRQFSDPDRRQALYFPGFVNGVGSAASSYDGQFRRAVSEEPDLLKQFTVECWIKPEGDVRDAVIVERTCNYGPSTLSNNTYVIRANFRIGLDELGRIYGEFEGSTANSGHVRVSAPTQAESVWTHVAFTFNGNAAYLYLNGDVSPVASATGVGLIPANGVSDIQQEYYASVMRFGYIALPCATVLGAKALNGKAISLSKDTTWDDFGSYYRGWVDEVRIWDGARSATDINAAYRKRFTMDDLKSMRSNSDGSGVFDQWKQGLRRYGATGATLSPELVQHYNFVTLPGGVEPKNVMTEPVGFQKNVFDNVRKPNGRALDDSLLAGWWSQTPVHSTVYWNHAVIPWIGNTAAHLPYMDGSSPDSQYWATTLAGVCLPAQQGLTSYDYPNDANPYPYFMYNRERYHRLRRLSTIENGDVSTNSVSETLDETVVQGDITTKWAFQLRGEFIGTSDLVPLGGAFAKRGEDYWDGAGAMDAWTETSLNGETADSDGDGIPDWAENLGLTTETYLNWLAKGLLPTNALPIVTNGTVVVTNSPSTSGYTSLVDKNEDGVKDWWQNKYGLIDSVLTDTDHDGLADYAEYLVTEVFKFGEISPLLSMTNGKEFDYFRKVGKLYLGEMFSDHDFMEDGFERQWTGIGADPAYYDAHLDADEDGWSNWAEVRAQWNMGYGINVDEGSGIATNTVTDTGPIASYWYYTDYLNDLRAIRNNEKCELIDTDFTIIGRDDGFDSISDDAFYGTGYIKYRVRTKLYGYSMVYRGLPEPEVTMTVRYNGLADLKGKSLFVQSYTDDQMLLPDATFLVDNGDNRNVNTVTFKYPISGYLREGKNTFVVFAASGTTNAAYAAGVPFGVVRGVDVGWSKVEFEVELTEKSPICSRPVMPTNSTSQIYVYRYAVDGFNPPSSLEYGPILVKDIGNRGYLHEGDFLSDAEFDIDWTNFADEVLDNVTVSRYELPVTSVVYRVYSSPVNIDQEALLASNATPYVAFSRDFGLTRAVAKPVSPGADSTILYGASPTFTWRMEGDMPDSFTAFAIQVKAGDEVVWNSGLQRAPARRIDGCYAWKAPLYAGDQTTLGKVFGNMNNYTWSVTMYNSKYQDDQWSDPRMFRVNAALADEVNSASYYGFNVAVKYFGPDGMVNGDASRLAGTLRVEAYSSPDFSGEPVSRTFVTDVTSVKNTGATINAKLSGLTAGTYYVRAYIDSDGDMKRSVWESCGYACPRGDAASGAIYAPTPIAVGDGIKAPTVTVYVEDCDTDQDCLPDVWEYENAGSDKTDFLLKQGPFDNKENGYIAVNPELATSISGVLSGNLKLLSAAPGRISASVAALALGVPSVEPALDESTLAIESLTLEDGVVTLTLGAAAEDPTSGTVFFSGGTVKATILVKYAESLGGDWNVVEVPFEQKIEDGAVSATYSFRLSDLGLDASKGFFKVEVK